MTGVIQLVRSIFQDLRYAARQLRRAPGFTLTVLLTLVFTIGATTAMISVLQATLLNATPYPQAEQLISIRDTNLKGFKTNGLVTIGRAFDLASADSGLDKGTPRGKLLSSSAFYYFDQPALIVSHHAPIPVTAAGASGSFFTVLDVAPLLGRTFTLVDDAHGAPEVTVVSYGLWQRAFGGDVGIVGTSVMLGGKATTVIGVMPQRFDFPAGTEAWKPAHYTAQDFAGYRGPNVRFVNVIARLSGAITQRQAMRATAALASQLARRYPETDAEWGFKVESLRAEIIGSYREGLVLVSAAVGILLLIACVNIAGLQLARNARRQPEMALRRALGGSNRRLLGQLLTESLLLTMTGGTLGVALAMALLRGMASRLPAPLLSFEQPRIDGMTLAVTTAVVVMAGILCAILPALQFRSVAVAEALSPGQTRTVAQGARRFGGAFAVVQIALALVLLTLASSVLQSLYHLLQAQLGYEPSHVLTTSVHLPFGSDPAKIHRFNQQLEERIAALPGVEVTGAITALPLSSFSSQWTSDIAGRPGTPHHDTATAEVRNVTPTYFAAMQIPLLAGRVFTRRDVDPGMPSVVMINQSFARTYFPQENPLGQRLLTGDTTTEIVGVTGNVRGTGGNINDAVRPEIYFPHDGGWPEMHFAIRTAQTSAQLEPALRRTLSSLDPTAALGPVELLSASVDRALQQPRLNSELLTALAGLALLLVLVGVYGVIAFSVVQRRRDLGVRLALGSSRAAIFRLLLSESCRILLVGLLLGVGASIIASHLLIATVAGVSAPIGSTLLITSLLLASAVLMASTVPAYRAASTDPMQALRTE